MTPLDPSDPNLLKLPDWFLGMVAPRERAQLSGTPLGIASADSVLAASLRELFGVGFQDRGTPLSPPPAALAPPRLPILEPDARWRRVIVHPSVVLVLGKRGSGKSALGYRLLELFRYRLRPYAVGITPQARRLLPEWVWVSTRGGW